MSNIQLWMTPKRDFTVFFPWLHIVILGSIQLSDLITTYLMYHYHWTYMNLFIAGLMLIVLLIQFTCVKHFRFMRKFPLFGIDWLGGVLWAALLAEIAFLFNYGDWYDWWNSPVIRQLTIVIFHHSGYLYLAYDDNPPSFSRTEDVDLSPLLVLIRTSHISGSISCNRACIRRSLLRRSDEI